MLKRADLSESDVINQTDSIFKKNSSLKASNQANQLFKNVESLEFNMPLASISSADH